MKSVDIVHSVSLLCGSSILNQHVRKDGVKFIQQMCIQDSYPISVVTPDNQRILTFHTYISKGYVSKGYFSMDSTPGGRLVTKDDERIDIFE